MRLEAEGAGRRLVDLAGDAQPVGPLELHHRTGGRRPEDPVGAAGEAMPALISARLQGDDAGAALVVAWRSRTPSSPPPALAAAAGRRD